MWRTLGLLALTIPFHINHHWLYSLFPAQPQLLKQFIRLPELSVEASLVAV